MSFDITKEMAKNDSILVCHSDDFWPCDVSQASLIRFRFVESLGESPFACRFEKSSGEFSVLSSCKSINGSYRDQALNRPLAEAIFQYKPSVVYVKGLYGCTCDLPRIARLLNTDVYIILEENDLCRLKDIDDTIFDIVHTSLQAASGIVFEAGVSETGIQPLQKLFSDVPCYWDDIPPSDTGLNFPDQHDQCSSYSRFDYALYELMQRDHPLLYVQQKSRAIHFKGCESVLDLGCGVGVFLDVLRAENIKAEGVERDPAIVRYGKGMGLDIIEAEAIEFLSSTSNIYDGVYCSHFIEHLPFEAVKNLIYLISKKLKVGGVLVLAFPDPESIRAQLLGFWRDPEHVRFYHSQLVITLARACGMQCEWSSYDEQPHDLVPFPLQPPKLQLPSPPRLSSSVGGILEKILNRFGVPSLKQLQNVDKKLDLLHAQQENFNSLIEDRTDTLWSVSKTWGWNDDVTLRFRKC